MMMGCLPSRYTISPHRDRVNLKMHSEAVIVRVWRPRLCEFGDTPGGCDRASLNIHLEAVIVRTWKP